VAAVAPFTAARLTAALAAFNAAHESSALAWSTNLGHVDVYPATSGKRSAGLYVATRLLGREGAQERLQPEAASAGIDDTAAAAAATAFLCDDDNDLGLAAAVELVLVPQCTSASVAAAAAAAAHRAAAFAAALSEAAQDAAAHDQMSRQGPVFLVAPVGGCLGTEWCLRKALARATERSPSSSFPSSSIREALNILTPAGFTCCRSTKDSMRMPM
jgi:hypothetical protein